MSTHSGQPEIRFDKAGPFSHEGVAFTPKTITVKKTVAAAGNDDFWTIPADTFVSRVVAVVDTPLNATDATFTVGVDGDADMFINATDLDTSTAGNWATNIGSAGAVGAKGQYFAASDVMRLASTGTTLSAGVVRVIIEFYELAAMFARVLHFNE